MTNLSEVLKTLSVEDIEKLLKAVYQEGKSDGWNENSVENGYNGAYRESFSELEDEIIEEPQKIIKKWSPN